MDVVLFFDAFAKFQLIRHILSIDFNSACGGEQEQILCDESDDGQNKGEKLVFICCLIVQVPKILRLCSFGSPSIHLVTIRFLHHWVV